KRAAQERADAIALLEQGGRAGALSRVPGQEQQALVDAIDALAHAMQAGRMPGAAILMGATEAAGYRRIELFHQNDVRSVVCSPDGSKVVASGSSGEVFIYLEGEEYTLPTLPETLPTLPETVTFTAFTPDGAALVTGDHEGRVTLWPFVNGAPTLAD